jgi:hypothetical protein
VNLSDDAGENFLFAKLDNYPRTNVDLGLKVFWDLVRKHPRNWYWQDDIGEIISAFRDKKI